MGRSSLYRLVVGALTGALVAATLPGWATAYPSTPWDFSHSGAPHASAYSGGQPDPALSPANAVGLRPLLVIYVQYAEVYPGSPFGSPRRSAAELAGIVFTGFPSINGLFLANSGGRFGFSPVPETSGTLNDGVVEVNLGSLYATRALQNPPIGYALKAAEPLVDFAALDTNRDGCLAEQELIVLVVAEEPDNDAGTAPSRVGIPGDGLLDGKRFAAPPCRNNSSGIRAAGYASTYSPAFDYSHEIAHETFHLWDLYGSAGATYDPTGVPPGDRASSFNAWTKMHLGWVTPTVVSADGYYTVTTGTGTPTDAYILYDDQRGLDDYFIVENRQQTAGGYDAGVSDSGLLVWRVRDSWYGDVSNNAFGWWARPAMTIMRPDGRLPTTCSGLDGKIWPLSSCDPCPDEQELSGVASSPGSGTVSCSYGGRNDDLWDAGDPGTATLRSMTGRAWQDGVTPSNVGMFAVPPRGSAMRVYFDVRGPGILVDCGVPVPTIAASAGQTISLPVTVRNTGESFDTFVFTAASLPAGWSVATPSVLGLNAQEQQSTQVQVRVGGSQAPGTVAIDVGGFSTGASGAFSSCPIDVVVDQIPTTVSLVTSAAFLWGSQPIFMATVTGAPSTPLPGVTVRFTLTGDSLTNLLAGADAGPVPSQTLTATTNGVGLAAATPAITVPPGVYTLTASVLASGGWAAARASQTVTVNRRPTQVSYTGATSSQYSDAASVSAYLTDTATGAPVAGAIEFRVGAQATRVVGSSGDAGVVGSIQLDQPAGDHVLSASFAGNVYYLPAATHRQFQIHQEALLVQYTGTTLSTTAAKRNIVAVQAIEDDSTVIFPGDLTRAEIELRIDPTIGHGAPQHVTLHLGADGTQAWVLGSLQADVYRVGARVVEANPWYAGALGLPTELVVTSLTGRVLGSGSALDTAGGPVSLDADVAASQKAGVTGRFTVRFRDQLGDHAVLVSPPAWIAQNHGNAILQGTGSLDGQTVVVRVTIEDAGVHGADRIWFRVLDQLGTTLYESGSVALSTGNLRVG